MRIAVLALQGAFVEHEAMLRQLGVDSLRFANCLIGNSRRMD